MKHEYFEDLKGEVLTRSNKFQCNVIFPMTSYYFNLKLNDEKYMNAYEMLRGHSHELGQFLIIEPAWLPIKGLNTCDELSQRIVDVLENLKSAISYLKDEGLFQPEHLETLVAGLENIEKWVIYYLSSEYFNLWGSNSPQLAAKVA